MQPADALPEAIVPLPAHPKSQVIYDMLLDKYTFASQIEVFIKDMYCMAIVVGDKVLYNKYQEDTLDPVSIIQQRMMYDYITADVSRNLLANVERTYRDCMIRIYMYMATPWIIHIHHDALHRKYRLTFTQARHNCYVLKKDFSIDYIKRCCK